MPRLTITISEETHAALKETAARQGRSITALIEESLQFRGWKSTTSARDLVKKARRGSHLSADEAMDVALTESQSNSNN